VVLWNINEFEIVTWPEGDVVLLCIQLTQGFWFYPKNILSELCPAYPAEKSSIMLIRAGLELI